MPTPETVEGGREPEPVTELALPLTEPPHAVSAVIRAIHERRIVVIKAQIQPDLASPGEESAVAPLVTQQVR